MLHVQVALVQKSQTYQDRVLCVFLCACRRESVRITAQHNNPAAFCMPHLQATKWPIWKSATSADCAPVSPSPVLVGCVCVCCVWMSNLTQVSVGGLLVRLLSLTVEVDGKRNPFFWFSFFWKTLSGSGGLAGCIPLFVLIGTSWREEYDCGHWEGAPCSITFVTNQTPGAKWGSWVLSFGAHGPDIGTKLDFWGNSRTCFSVFCFFVCAFEPTLAVFLTERLQTCYCSHTNMELEWLSADSGCTPVRITARLPLHRNWIFTLQLKMPASWWGGFARDCSSQAHMISSTWTS